MSLATSPFGFTRHSHNYPSTPGNPGVAFTSGANEVDGAAVTALSALAHDVHFLRLRVSGLALSTADGNAAGDLLIDPAGGSSWSVLISDLVCGMSSGAGPAGAYEFPLWIPAGASLGWRAKTKHTADITTGIITVEAFGCPTRPGMWWCGQGVETIGISDSRGTVVTPGSSGAFGSWTNVGSVTARLLKAIQLGINGSDATSVLGQYYFQLGYGSTQLPGSSHVYVAMSTAESAPRNFQGLTTCSVPVGTQMQVRGICSGLAENFYAAIYGVY